MAGPGATWALRIGEGGFSGGFGYVRLVFMLCGVAGLAWSGITRRRLDRPMRPLLLLATSIINLRRLCADSRSDPGR